MRKFCCAFALLISICILFCACSPESPPLSVPEGESTYSTVKATEGTVFAETEISSITETTVQSSTTKSTSKSKQISSAKATVKSEKNSSASKKIKSSTTSVSLSTTTQSAEDIPRTTENNQEATINTTVAEAKSEKNTTSYSEITCDVLIECSAILDNMDNLKAGHDSYVPSDGVFLDTYTVTLPSGSTAYDALEKACSDNNIKINAQKTSFGIYVIGINNIDEKDCGKSSGWLYSVNDVFPQKSCGLYKLSNGDKVVFSYTC